MTVNEILKRGIYVLKKEGAWSFLSQAFTFLSRFFYSRRSFYIYEKPLTKNEQYYFKPILQNIEVKIIFTIEEFNELVFNGYDFKKLPFFKDRLEEGAIAFCAFINKEFANVTWLALNEKAKRAIDPLPLKVNFQKGEATTGSTITDTIFRGKKLHGYVYTYIYDYLSQKGFVKCRYPIDVNNISSQRGVARFNPILVGKGHYLKILWWKFWKEKPIKEL